MIVYICPICGERREVRSNNPNETCFYEHKVCRECKEEDYIRQRNIAREGMNWWEGGYVVV